MMLVRFTKLGLRVVNRNNIKEIPEIWGLQHFSDSYFLVLFFIFSHIFIFLFYVLHMRYLANHDLIHSHCAQIMSCRFLLATAAAVLHRKSQFSPLVQAKGATH